MTKLLRRKVFRSDKTAEWYGILEAFPFYLMNKFDGHILFADIKSWSNACFLYSCLLQNLEKCMILVVHRMLSTQTKNVWKH